MPVPLTSSERTAPHAKEMSIFYVAALLLIKTCPLTGSYGCCTSVETLSRNAPRPAPAGVNPTAQAPGQQETVDACCQGAAASRPVPVGLVGPSPSARRPPASAPLPIAGAACPKAGSCPLAGAGFLESRRTSAATPRPAVTARCRMHLPLVVMPPMPSTADSAGSGSRGPPAARWLGGRAGGSLV